jgi:hypothetical protein
LHIQSAGFSALLQLLLGAEVVAATALLLAAVVSTRVKTGIALAADELVSVVLAGKGLERGLDDTTAKAEHKVEGRLCSEPISTTCSKRERKTRTLLDVVVRKSAAILELLAGEDEALLVRRNALLILDLLLHILDGIRSLDLEGDGLAREGLDKDLHCTTFCM